MRKTITKMYILLTNSKMDFKTFSITKNKIQKSKTIFKTAGSKWNLKTISSVFHSLTYRSSPSRIQTISNISQEFRRMKIWFRIENRLHNNWILNSLKVDFVYQLRAKGKLIKIFRMKRLMKKKKDIIQWRKQVTSFI